MKTHVLKTRSLVWLLGLGVLVGSAVSARAAQPELRRLAVKVYRDKMKAGWIGQIAGVCVGGPTEFKYRDKIMPANIVPAWKAEMINNAFGQDDLYVEMTFLRSMEEYGLGVPIRQAGIDFANSGYSLWCANNAGRTNLRDGIAPPDSSHPKFNRCPNDIDYQIEADFSGLIAPAMPNVAIKLGEKFGRLMNYGDGMYAGQFMGGMYAEAFFEDDPVKIVQAGLKCIPAECQYAEMVRDMICWYGDDPDDWEKCWHKCQKKYREDPEYQKASNGGIDCKINGAYVLMGLLFGRRDLDQTIVISTRCGMDSDCNPSSSAGVLFTTIGFSKLPPRFSEKLDEERVFSHTAYNFPALLDVCEKLARQALAEQGGRVEKDAAGGEVFVIPVEEPQPSRLELSWAPGPIANSRFTEDDMSKITVPGSKEALRQGLEKFAPGWEIADCGSDMEPGFRSELAGKKNVFVTHPLNRQTACTLSKEVQVPAGGKTSLRLVVGHHPQGDWQLIVKAADEQLAKQTIGKETAPEGWTEVIIDLSRYAGQKVMLQLANQPTDWSWEAGYWAEIAVESR